MKKLMNTSDRLQADVLSDILLQNGIGVVRKSLGMHIYLGTSPLGEDLYVEEEAYERALKLVGQIGGPETEEEEEELSRLAESSVCPGEIIDGKTIYKDRSVKKKIPFESFSMGGKLFLLGSFIVIYFFIVLYGQCRLVLMTDDHDNNKVYLKEGIIQKKKDITSIKIQKGVNTIYREGFRDCVNLVSIQLPEGLQLIEDGAFVNCERLTAIGIPEGVEGISMFAFSGCYSLEYMELPDSLTWIGAGAFHNCVGLKQIRLPEGLEYIGDYAFDGCINLETIQVPKHLKDSFLYSGDGELIYY